MSLLRTGLVATSRKEHELRVPIHPQHLASIDGRLRRALVLEHGYGERFGMPDQTLLELGCELASRSDVLTGCPLILLPKPMPEDLRDLPPETILWGWPHCVQQRDIAQIAIDRRLTLVAFEAMFGWSPDGHRQAHVFARNNELAGYCAVLHALQLLGRDGHYGPPQRAAILGFGSVSRGAAYALLGRGYGDISVFTQRPAHLVADPLFGCRFARMSRGAPGAAMSAQRSRGRPRALVEELAEVNIIVNGTLQDTDDPLMYLREGEQTQLEPGSLIVDVSCDTAMGFRFARPTRFDRPIFIVPDSPGVVYYGVDHTPSYLWDSASWVISAALLPYLETVMSGPEAWEASPTIAHAVEIRDGRILNPKIISFQERASEYPHESAAGRS